MHEYRRFLAEITLHHIPHGTGYRGQTSYLRDRHQTTNAPFKGASLLGNQRNHFTKHLNFAANFKREKDRVIGEEVLSLDVPLGSRFRVYGTIFVRDQTIATEPVRSRRKRRRVSESSREVTLDGERCRRPCQAVKS